jgi:hypothetical protein
MQAGQTPKILFLHGALTVETSSTQTILRASVSESRKAS